MSNLDVLIEWISLRFTYWYLHYAFQPVHSCKPFQKFRFLFLFWVHRMYPWLFQRYHIHDILAPQNSYSISHLLDTVTTQWLPLWRCSHSSLVPDIVTTEQWLHRTHMLLGIHYHGAPIARSLHGKTLVGERIITTSSLSSHSTVTTWGVLLCNLSNFKSKLRFKNNVRICCCVIFPGYCTFCVFFYSGAHCSLLLFVVIKGSINTILTIGVPCVCLGYYVAVCCY